MGLRHLVYSTMAMLVVGASDAKAAEITREAFKIQWSECIPPGPITMAKEKLVQREASGYKIVVQEGDTLDSIAKQLTDIKRDDYLVWRGQRGYDITVKGNETSEEIVAKIDILKRKDQEEIAKIVVVADDLYHGNKDQLREKPVKLKKGQVLRHITHYPSYSGLLCF